MSGFSPEWLALREPADHRSRNSVLVKSLAAQFVRRDSVSVVDLGSGTGSNLRAIYRLLPHKQDWTLVDYDASLLEAAKQQLIAWADSREISNGGIILQKDDCQIALTLRQADLSRDLDAVLERAPDLVTASALFDLMSEEFIRRCAGTIARHRAAFYTVLTFDGVLRWTPSHAGDDAVAAAFNRHQTSDKGFGPAAGPSAARHLAQAFRNTGYAVEEGESPWRFAGGDAALIEQVAAGVAAAAAETGAVDAGLLRDWLAARRVSALVGHVDILGRPL